MSDVKKVYPSWRYHKDGDSKIVHSEAEHKALGADWAQSPAHFEKQDEVAPELAWPMEGDEEIESEKKVSKKKSK